MRRFEKKCLMDLPLEEARLSLFEQLNSLHSLALTPEQISNLTLKSDGLSGSEIKNTLRDFVLKRIYTEFDEPNSKKCPCFDDLIASIEKMPSVMVSLAEKHRKWHTTNVNKTQTF